MSQPQKVVVYRSQAEQMADEFWWSEGYFTATKAGDALVLGVLVLVVSILGSTIYQRIRRRFF